jgi:hypothetical protein
VVPAGNAETLKIAIFAAKNHHSVAMTSWPVELLQLDEVQLYIYVDINSFIDTFILISILAFALSQGYLSSTFNFTGT